MGRSEDKIAHSLQLFEHLQGLGTYLPNMAKLIDWEVKGGTLYALFEYIEATENRPATIAEMVDISTTAFLASRKYDYTKVAQAVDAEVVCVHGQVGAGLRAQVMAQVLEDVVLDLAQRREVAQVHAVPVAAAALGLRLVEEALAYHDAP